MYKTSSTSRTKGQGCSEGASKKIAHLDECPLPLQCVPAVICQEGHTSLQLLGFGLPQDGQPLPVYLGGISLRVLLQGGSVRGREGAIRGGISAGQLRSRRMH